MNTIPGFKIPFTGLRRQYHNLKEEILDVTDRVLESGQLMNGPWTDQFEAWLATKNHTAHAVACHSGTHALEIIAGYWKTQEYNERPCVLVPSLTFSATAHAFMRAGWDIHFVDVDAHGLINPSAIPPNLSYQAVVVVGLYGASAAPLNDAILEWLYQGVVVIEDAAQHWLSADCLRLDDGSAISFDPMKNLACYGNGGAVVTNSSDLATYARAWGNHNKGRYKVPDGGSNSRMSELDCAHMMVKSRHLDQWQARRRQIATYMCDQLSNSNLRCLIDDTNSHDHAFHKFVIDVDHRKTLQERLWDASIDTRIHYAQPLHDDPVLRQFPGPDMLSVATALSQRVLSLPIYPELTDSEIEYVVSQVKEIV